MLFAWLSVICDFESRFQEHGACGGEHGEGSQDSFSEHLTSGLVEASQQISCNVQLIEYLCHIVYNGRERDWVA